MAELQRVTTRFAGAPVQGGGINQMYFFPDSDVTGEVAQTAAIDFWEDLKADIDSDVSITVSGEVEFIDSTTGEITAVADVGDYATAGTSSGEMLPPTIQALLRFPTTTYVAGRRLRGRVFVPAMAEGNSDGGVPGSGLMGRVAGAGATLIANTEAGFVVYSRTHRIYAAPASASCWNKWAVLRSRRD